PTFRDAADRGRDRADLPRLWLLHDDAGGVGSLKTQNWDVLSVLMVKALRNSTEREHAMSDREFTEYVEANYDRFLRFLRVYAGQHAEDVLQATLLKLWMFRETIDGTSIDALVFTALRNATISQWREQTRQPKPDKRLRSAIDGHTPEQAAQQQEMAQALRSRLAEALAALTPRGRRALAVWLIQHPGREQAGAILGVTKSAYSAAVNGALEKLTKTLIPHQQFLLQALAVLGSQQAFDVLAEVFQGDLPEQQ